MNASWLVRKYKQVCFSMQEIYKEPLYAQDKLSSERFLKIMGRPTADMFPIKLLSILEKRECYKKINKHISLEIIMWIIWRSDVSERNKRLLMYNIVKQLPNICKCLDPTIIECLSTLNEHINDQCTDEKLLIIRRKISDNITTSRISEAVSHGRPDHPLRAMYPVSFLPGEWDAKEAEYYYKKFTSGYGTISDHHYPIHNPLYSTYDDVLHAAYDKESVKGMNNFEEFVVQELIHFCNYTGVYTKEN